MDFTILMWLSSPMTLLMAIVMLAGWRHVSRKPNTRPEDAGRIVNAGSGSPEALGSALMFLSMAYRPNHAFVAKAQIVQREDEDDDEAGGPDTPQRQLMRQLRRIRRGEVVDRLVWRLE